jgi:TatA/E family protein of Tat protein translocase
LAIVVIGGLVSATALTLFVLPVLYTVVEEAVERRAAARAAAIALSGGRACHGKFTRCRPRAAMTRELHMLGLRMPELLIIGFIVVLLFGSNKLPELGSGLGQAIRGFKKAMSGEDEKPAAPGPEKTEPRA